MADISSLVKSVGTKVTAENSTSKSKNTELSMTDFLQLMVVQLQSQTLDDTMDTSEMMNQMVQMQMITAITNMTETNIMSYASSLVGKEVTIGIVNGDTLEERLVEVTGTAMSNGQQIIFGKDEKGNIESYNLNQIMAIGRLPAIDEDGNFIPENVNKPGDAAAPANPTAPIQPTNPTDPADPSDETGDVSNKPVENPDAGTESGGENTDDSNAGDAVNPSEPVG